MTRVKKQAKTRATEHNYSFEEIIEAALTTPKDKVMKSIKKEKESKKKTKK